MCSQNFDIEWDTFVFKQIFLFSLFFCKKLPCCFVLHHFFLILDNFIGNLPCFIRILEKNHKISFFSMKNSPKFLWRSCFYFIFWGSPISVQFEFTFFFEKQKKRNLARNIPLKKALWKNVMILEKEVWYSWAKKTEADCSAKVIKKEIIKKKKTHIHTKKPSKHKKW